MIQKISEKSTFKRSKLSISMNKTSSSKIAKKKQVPFYTLIFCDNEPYKQIIRILVLILVFWYVLMSLYPVSTKLFVQKWWERKDKINNKLRSYSSCCFISLYFVLHHLKDDVFRAYLNHQIKLCESLIHLYSLTNALGYNL